MKSTLIDSPEVAQNDVDLIDPFLERGPVRKDDGVIEEIEEVVAPFPKPWRQPLRFTYKIVGGALSFVSLMLILAVLAAIPIINFFALGYFLNVERRVGRSGRLLDAFPLINQAPRVLTIAAGIWIFLLPIRFLSSFAVDAHLIDPGSPTDVNLRIVLNVVWAIVTVHLILALARGGTFWCFVRPFKNFFWLIAQIREGTYLKTAHYCIAEFIRELEIKRHFWLGIRGFAVAFFWLFVPTALFAIAQEPEGGQILLTIVGGIMLAVVLSWVPFLQARFAVEDNFRAGLQLGAIRNLWRHAPIAWSFSLFVLYALSLPLYLFKAFLLPPDAMWPITLIFVVSMYPARVLLGWAYHRATVKQANGKKSHWAARIICSMSIIALIGIFVFILFFTQFLGEEGKRVLFHHHSVLLPAPFQGNINP